MKLDQTLNGGYNGLYGEVVDKDIYRVRTVEDIVSINDPAFIHEKGHAGIDFIPDVVFDFGANIGVFTRYAQSLWPNAQIVSVEPHPANCEIFKHFTKDVMLVEKAIGTGELYHFAGAINGSGESYISPGIGMDTEAMKHSAGVLSTIKTVMPDALINLFVRHSQKFLVKMDIEGGENAVFAHKPSMDALRRADYFCMEVHFYGLTETAKTRREIMKVLASFEATHNCTLDHVTFYARKK